MRKQLRYLSIFLMLSFFSLPANAIPLINVDSRIDISFSEMEVGQTAKHYSTWATVTNTSSVEIHSPIRLLIKDIDNKNTTLSNADGFAGEGFPFVEIDFPGPALAPGESSVPTVIRFHRPIGNYAKGSSGNGKNKKSGFPGIDFSFSVEGGSELVLSKPASFPAALAPDSGIVSVVFNASLQTSGSPVVGNIWLRNLSNASQVMLRDDGLLGDRHADDGIYSISDDVDTTGLSSGDCSLYSAFTQLNGLEIESNPYQLCASNFPLTIDPSTQAAHVAVNGSPAIANEVLVFMNTGATEADVISLLNAIGGEVIGSILSSGLYQIQLPGDLSVSNLNKLISKISGFSAVANAGPNYVGVYTTTPDDPQFSSQHGLALVSSDNPALPSPRYVWDASATGSGGTVLVLDSGISAGHPDLVVLAENSLGDNTDTLGHGTEMAGLIAATTDNATGVAGIARSVAIQSIKISADANVTQAEMIAGLNAAAPLSGPNTIVNASFSIFGPLLPTAGLCGAVNDLINSGAVVVNSAGNDNNSTTGVWPGMCNDPAFNAFLPDIIADVNKPSFIVVAASNCSSGACASDSLKSDSNFGGWVDIAAPGVSQPTTTIAVVNPTLYTNSDGTSAAAALTSGAAAILRSCGVASASVFNTLNLGATVAVTADFNRINIYNSLASLNVSPSALAVDNMAIDELASPGDITAAPVTVGGLSANSGNICDALSYSIVGGADAGSFVIDGSNLQFDSGVKLDAETKSSFDVTLRVSDFFGATSGDLPITVNLNDIAEAPSGSLFDIDFEAFTVGASAPEGVGSDRITGSDGNLTTDIENAASISPVAALASGKFARLQESNGESPDLYFDNGLSFGSGTFSVSMDVLFETDDSYHIYVRDGSGNGPAAASQSILNVRHSGGNLRFSSYTAADETSQITTIVAQPAGVSFNLSLSFDLDSLTYEAFIDGVQVVNAAAFHTGRSDETVPAIGRVIAGLDFTSFDPQPTGFDGVMQIDNILIQHVP